MTTQQTPADAAAPPRERYDGAGNRFYVVDLDAEPGPAYAEAARALCATPGAPADGVIALSPAAEASRTLRVFNADGSTAEMCGNGARCAVVAWLLALGRRENRSIVPAGARVVFDTLAGRVACELLDDLPTTRTDGVYAVRTRLEAPRATWGDAGLAPRPGDPPVDADAARAPLAIAVDGVAYDWYGLSTGNPHVVAFVEDVAAVDVARVGRAVERDPRFPRGVNVHVARVEGPDALRVRHWERGAGETPACGTGAAACAVVAIERGLVASPVRVEVPGGTLRVAWAGAEIELTGPVRVLEPVAA